MIRLQRFTTEYVPEEDRICVLGRATDGGAVIQRIWLTARLLRRVVPILLERLEPPRQMETPRGAAIQRFAQQAARAEQPTLPRVTLPATPEASISWVAHAVRVRHTAESLTLTFKGPGEEEAQLVLVPKLHRQWLNILHDHWVRAGWPLDLWPAWMREGADPVKAQAAGRVY